jgi:predicted TPR repeat methyltransferase
MNTDLQIAVDAKVRQHYDTVWSGDDPWSFDSSDYEQRRFAHQLDLLSDRRYRRALEIGCGGGAFSRLLSPLVDDLIAIDVSEVAIQRAMEQNPQLGNTRFVARNIMQFDVSSSGPWELVIFSETIYCLGWLYPLFDVGWLLSQLFDSMNAGGRLLLSNTLGQERDYLLRPWLIETYRDLLTNIGFELDCESTFQGVKDGTTFNVLTSRFTVPATRSVVDVPSQTNLKRV